MQYARHRCRQVIFNLGLWLFGAGKFLKSKSFFCRRQTRKKTLYAIGQGISPDAFEAYACSSLTFQLAQVFKNQIICRRRRRFSLLNDQIRMNRRYFHRRNFRASRACGCGLIGEDARQRRWIRWMDGWRNSLTATQKVPPLINSSIAEKRVKTFSEKGHQLIAKKTVYAATRSRFKTVCRASQNLKGWAYRRKCRAG